MAVTKTGEKTTRAAAGGARRRRSTQARSKRLNVRLSEAEYAAVTTAAEASGLSRGAWLAATAQASIDGHRDPLAALPHREALAELIAARTELARVGNNLNQLARKANEGVVVGAAAIEAATGELMAAVVAVDEATADVGAQARRKR